MILKLPYITPHYRTKNQRFSNQLINKHDLHRRPVNRNPARKVPKTSSACLPPHHPTPLSVTQESPIKPPHPLRHPPASEPSSSLPAIIPCRCARARAVPFDPFPRLISPIQPGARDNKKKTPSPRAARRRG